MTTLLHIIGAIAIVWGVANLLYVVQSVSVGSYRLGVPVWQPLVFQTLLIAGGLFALGVIR